MYIYTHRYIYIYIYHILYIHAAYKIPWFNSQVVAIRSLGIWGNRTAPMMTKKQAARRPCPTCSAGTNHQCKPTSNLEPAH